MGRQKNIAMIFSDTLDLHQKASNFATPLATTPL
jgi:hypothetical protein